MSEEDQKDSDIEVARQAIELLGEHFDAVQIFATRYESDRDGGTMNLQMGTGNWFARYGHVENWLNYARENTREKARKEYGE